jgi:hypothetical protein
MLTTEIGVALRMTDDLRMHLGKRLQFQTAGGAAMAPKEADDDRPLAQKAG